MDKSNGSSADVATCVTRRPGGRVMLITPDRVVYAGLLGRPLMREFGALTVYVSLGSPFLIQTDGDGWQNAEMFVVAPDTPHQITTMDRSIGVIMIEPESISMDKLPSFLQSTPPSENAAAMVDQLRRAFASLVEGRTSVELIRNQVDQFLFGQVLTPCKMEPRIAKVVNTIKLQPSDALGAEACALQVNLSFSRFLHLFKEEVRTPFRKFCAWKRARSFLAFVNTPLNLTDIAFEAGYNDSSHFSHAIRRCWGLTPRDIVAGSRRLAVTHDGDGSQSARC